MIQGLTNVVRVSEREMGGVNRSKELSYVGESPVRGISMATETLGGESAPFFGNEVDEFAAVINFQLVPSGKIHMNREEREHIVDFFQ
jgi:hypothetical protein